MNPKPQQYKLPQGYNLKRQQTGDGIGWEVYELATGQAIVIKQKNPKIAVERALRVLNLNERNLRQ